ncbi:aldehyde dehydrogenase [Corynebacterium diphtheriae]|nr:aldehyde dehydrogenase [Corynebacterium diphtheriae]
MTIYAYPGTPGAVANYKKRYDNYIGGQWVPPVGGEYLDNITPVTGEVFCQVARGTAVDVEKALDAAHDAAKTWGHSSPAERALILHRIADRMEEHLEEIAVAETWDNGKAVRETLAADIPLAIDHSATLPAQSVPKNHEPRRSTTTRWPTTSMSPSA